MKASVVVATRDADRTLERCLRSVRSQTYAPLEIVVVDNGSTDDTVGIAEVFADVVIGGGPERSAQRNAGVLASSGDVVVFVDADMVLEPGVIDEAVGHLRHPGTPAVVIPERSFGDGVWARAKALEKDLAREDPAVEAARAFRRRDVEAVRGYDESLVACEDWDLADRVVERAGGAPARTRSGIWHDEGALALRGTFAKKRYYGRWVARWWTGAPAHRRRRDLAGRVGDLARRPWTAVALVIMKLVEATGFALGVRDARRGGVVPASAAAPSARPVVDPTRRGVRRATLAAALVGVAAVQSWFRAGAFVAAGDNGPWMRGLGSVTRAWSDALSGTGSTAYPSASLFEALLHDGFAAVGLSDTFGQRVYYSLVVAVTAAAVCTVAATVVRRPIAVAAAGVVAVLAPFHVTTLPNVLPMIAIATLAVLVTLVVRLARGEIDSVRRAVPLAVVAAVWMAPLGKNPPLLVLVMACAAVVGGAVLVRPTTPRRAIVARLAGAGAWFGAAAAFWVVPLVIHYGLGTPGLRIVAEIDVDAWSWTQRHSGPANVVTLVASWVWGDPHILPATATLAAAPWSWLRWALPTGALAALPLARRRRLAGALLAATALFVVLATGVNAPFGPVNEWLSAHVPGFWLFRQPMSKFGVVLVLLDAVLVALAIDGLAARAPAWRPALRRGAHVGAATLAVAVVAFAHPLYVGTVIPGQRPGPDGLPPARVEVPQSWYDAGAWLDRAPLPGSVVVLPLADYYQRGTTWGYYGVDDLMWRVSDRPGLFLLPGGYYEAAGSTPRLLRALESALASGDDGAVVRLMDALGASYLAIRTDVATTARRTFVPPSTLITAADRATQLHHERDFEHVRFYSAPPVPSGSTMIDAAPGTSDDELGDIIAAAPRGTLVVDDDGRPGSATAWHPSGGVTSRSVDAAPGDQRVTVHTRTAPVWRAVVGARPDGGAVVRVESASGISLDGAPVTPGGGIALPSPSTPVALDVDGRIVPLDPDGPTLFEATPGSRVSLLGDGPTARLDPDDVDLGNCNNVGRRTLAEAGISATADPGPTPTGVTLRAASDSACAIVGAPAAEAGVVAGRGALWHVQATYERTDGAATRLCLWLPAARRCAAGTPQGTTEPTGRFDFVAGPDGGEDAAGAQLVVYADHADGAPVPAVTRWADVTVAPVESVGGDAVLPTATTDGVVRTLPGGRSTLTSDPALAADLAAPWPETPEVGDCHDYDDAPAALAAVAIDDGVRLSAGRHSACVHTAVDVPDGLRHVTIGFEHRSPAGGGRWCLRGPAGDCVAEGRLDPAADWTTVEADAVVDAGDPFGGATTGGLQLYLYADGAGPGERPTTTTVEYREVAVRPTSPVVVVVQPLRPPLESNTLTARRAARIAGGSTTLVRFDQAFADGWRIDGLPDGVTATHLRVDGWANGWILRGLDHAVEVRFVFGPDRWAGLAVWGLVPVLVAAALVTRRKGTTP